MGDCNLDITATQWQEYVVASFLFGHCGRHISAVF